MLQYKPVGESVTVVIAGELDHCAAPQIRHMLDDLIRDPGVTDMVLDLENLTFMDSSGIGVLLGRLRILQSRGGTLSVKNMQPSDGTKAEAQTECSRSRTAGDIAVRQAKQHKSQCGTHA